MLAASPAAAQQEQGDKELSIFATTATSFGGGTPTFTNGTIVPGIGYFITRQVEVSGISFISISGGGGTGTSVDFGLGGTLDYNFAKEGRKAFPYLGIELDWFNVSGSPRTNDVEIRPHGGFKFFVKRNVALDLNAGYRRGISGPFKDAGLNIIDVRFGIKFIF
jgi:hypothetical protein